MIHENWYPENQLRDLVILYRGVVSIVGSVIEIGCWEGKSSIALANASYPESLICNDTWLGNQAESIVTGATHLTEQIVAQRDVHAEFIKNMDAGTQGNYSIVRRDCIEWLKTVSTPIKFCHVDASHDYQSVKTTLQLLLPLMTKGGILCGDDFTNAHAGRLDLAGGVERAVREVLPAAQNKGNLWYWVGL